MNINDLIGNHTTFLDLVFNNLRDIRFDVSKYDLDHIAYRAVTPESYEKISDELLRYGKKVNQKIIRNRAVDVYLLNEPLVYMDRKILYFEVLAPAEGDKFNEGLEHCEFVVKDIGLLDLVNRFGQVKWNLKSIDRKIGAEAGILFENGVGVKFKNQTTPEIIELEEKAKVNN